MRDYVGRYGTRGIFTVAGFVVLVAGLVAAWDVDNSTALLVVGGVLLVLGLLNPKELRARYKDWEFILKRTEQVLNEAARAPDTEIRGLIEQARVELGQVRAAEALPRPIRMKDLQQALGVESLKRLQVVRAFAAKEFAPPVSENNLVQGREGLIQVLKLRIHWVVSEQVECAVIDQEGVEYQTMVKGRSGLVGEFGVVPVIFLTEYPSDFDAPPLSTGRYRVEWRNPANPDDPVVATDSFAVHE